jgi:hypothetical protein
MGPVTASVGVGRSPNPFGIWGANDAIVTLKRILCPEKLLGHASPGRQSGAQQVTGHMTKWKENTQETDKVEHTYIAHAIRSVLIRLAPPQMAWCDSDRHRCDENAVLAR